MTKAIVPILALALTYGTPASLVAAELQETESCFLLWKRGVGEVRRAPSSICDVPLSPASTFKVPHALAALDSGVIASPREKIPWDGKGQWAKSAQRPHDLASAIRHSVVWYFQIVARRLGMEKEREHLAKFKFGNADPSSGLTTFWLGQSLEVTPGEQLLFWQNLYSGQLPAKQAAMDQVKEMLRQPPGIVVDARGEHVFAAPWLSGVVVSAKTGSVTDSSGQGVRWIIGHVERSAEQYIFVSAVRGSRDLAADAAIDLAQAALKQEGVL